MLAIAIFLRALRMERMESAFPTAIAFEFAFQARLSGSGYATSASSGTDGCRSSSASFAFATQPRRDLHEETRGGPSYRGIRNLVKLFGAAPQSLSCTK